MLVRVPSLILFEAAVPAWNGPEVPVQLIPGQVWADVAARTGSDYSLAACFECTSTFASERAAAEADGSSSTASNSRSMWCTRAKPALGKSVIVIGLRRAVHLSAINIELGESALQPELIGVEVMTRLPGQPPIDPHDLLTSTAKSSSGNAWCRIAVLPSDVVSQHPRIPIDVQHVVCVRLSLKGYHSRNADKYHAVKRCVMYERVPTLEQKDSQPQHRSLKHLQPHRALNINGAVPFTQNRDTLRTIEQWAVTTATGNPSASPTASPAHRQDDAAVGNLAFEPAVQLLMDLCLSCGSLSSLLSLTQVLVDRGAAPLSPSMALHMDMFLAKLAARADAAGQRAFTPTSADGGAGSPLTANPDRFPEAKFTEHSSNINVDVTGRRATSRNSPEVASLNVGISEGRMVWEMAITHDTVNEECQCFGVCRRPIGSLSYETSKDMWVWRAYNGRLYGEGAVADPSSSSSSSASAASKAKFHQGDTVRFELDMERGGGQLLGWVNGAEQGVLFDGLKKQGTLYPCVQFYSSNRSAEVRRVWVYPRATPEAAGHLPTDVMLLGCRSEDECPGPVVYLCAHEPLPESKPGSDDSRGGFSSRRLGGPLGSFADLPFDKAAQPLLPSSADGNTNVAVASGPTRAILNGMPVRRGLVTPLDATESTSFASHQTSSPVAEIAFDVASLTGGSNAQSSSRKQDDGDKSKAKGKSAKPASSSPQPYAAFDTFEAVVGITDCVDDKGHERRDVASTGQFRLALPVTDGLNNAAESVTDQQSSSATTSTGTDGLDAYLLFEVFGVIKQHGNSGRHGSSAGKRKDHVEHELCGKAYVGLRPRSRRRGAGELSVSGEAGAAADADGQDGMNNDLPSELISATSRSDDTIHRGSATPSPRGIHPSHDHAGTALVCKIDASKYHTIRLRVTAVGPDAGGLADLWSSGTRAPVWAEARVRWAPWLHANPLKRCKLKVADAPPTATSLHVSASATLTPPSVLAGRPTCVLAPFGLPSSTSAATESLASIASTTAGSGLEYARRLLGTIREYARLAAAGAKHISNLSASSVGAASSEASSPSLAAMGGGRLDPPLEVPWACQPEGRVFAACTYLIKACMAGVKAGHRAKVQAELVAAASRALGSSPSSMASDDGAASQSSWLSAVYHDLLACLLEVVHVNLRRLVSSGVSPADMGIEAGAGGSSKADEQQRLFSLHPLHVVLRDIAASGQGGGAPGRGSGDRTEPASSPPTSASAHGLPFAVTALAASVIDSGMRLFYASPAARAAHLVDDVLGGQGEGGILEVHFPWPAPLAGSVLAATLPKGLKGQRSGGGAGADANDEDAADDHPSHLSGLASFAGQDPRFERAILILQAHAGARGWPLRVTGRLGTSLHLVMAVPDTRSHPIGRFLNVELSQLLAAAGLPGWAFPDGCGHPSPEVGFSIERQVAFDRQARLESDPGIGWVRLYPRRAGSVEDIVAQVSVFIEQQREQQRAERRRLRQRSGQGGSGMSTAGRSRASSSPSVVSELSELPPPPPVVDVFGDELPVAGADGFMPDDHHVGASPATSEAGDAATVADVDNDDDQDNDDEDEEDYDDEDDDEDQDDDDDEQDEVDEEDYDDEDDDDEDGDGNNDDDEEEGSEDED